MTRKRRRAALIVASLALIGAAVGLMGWAFQQKVTFFKSPSEVLSGTPNPDERIRLGGLVEAGTYRKGPGTLMTFRISDGSKSVSVTYNDIPPDLFKEGQGAIAEGHLGRDGVFVADKILAKHDEKYMPPEVADALKKSGHWQETSGKGKPAAPGT
jgi:cytochrome c-type biogenesis protein CcmE